jgi:hypothetical protein
MMTMTLTRSALGPDWTPGELSCPRDDGSELVLATLELPWRSNAPRVSCIPAGTYPVQYAWSDRWNMLVPLVLDVPHRDMIEFHVGNFARDTEGCILVGTAASVNGIAGSRSAFARFNAWFGRACREHVQVTITDPPVRPVVETA